MRGRLLQRFVLAAATLAMVAGVWFLPRAVSSGVSPPPASIELRSRREAPASGREPPASPEPTARSRAVDDRRDDADDGEARKGDRAERRTSRESVPDSTWRADDDGDDEGDDDGNEADRDDGDDDQDDD